MKRLAKKELTAAEESVEAVESASPDAEPSVPPTTAAPSEASTEVSTDASTPETSEATSPEAAPAEAKPKAPRKAAAPKAAAPEAASSEAAPEVPATEVAAVEATPETAAPEGGEAAPSAPAAQGTSQTSVQAERPRRANAPADLTPDLKSSGVQSEGKEVAGGRTYEITFIVRAGVQGAAEESSERVRAMIDGAQGAVDNVRISEIRRMAYPINKQPDGVYVVVNARFQKALTGELDRFFKLEENVLRHLILREDD